MHPATIEAAVAAPLPAVAGARAARRIALVTTHWGPPWDEGVRNLARRVVDFFRQQGAEVTVVAPRLGPDKGRAGRLMMRIPALQSLLFSLTAALDARRTGASVVLMIASASPVLGLRSWLIHLATGGRPVVLYVTGRRSVVLGCRALLRARSTLVNTPALLPLFPGAAIVPPFTDASRWSPPPRPGPPERPVILFLGAFERCRGVEYLIEAMDHLPPRLDASLVLAWNGRGGRHVSAVMCAIRASRASSRISVVHGGNVEHLYAEAAVVVIPRITPERMAFPLRIIEAMSMETPLVVTTVNGMDGLVEGCGLGVPPRNARALAAALERLLTDADLYRTLVAGCRDRLRLFDSAHSLAVVDQTLVRHAS